MMAFYRNAATRPLLLPLSGEEFEGNFSLFVQHELADKAASAGD